MSVDWVVVGLDNGGTTNNGTILDSSGRFLLDRMAEVPSEVREGPDKAIHALVLSVEQVLGLTGVPITAVRAVGLDTPGPASADGVISSKGATNFGHVGWRGFDIRGALAERLGLPVIYNNDGNVAALYAHNIRFRAESGQRSSVSAIVGTGLGGGIIQTGRVVKGAAGMAGELGHVPIPLDGLVGDGQPMPACNCGQSGDAESVASLTGIQNNLLPYWLTRYKGHPLGEVPIGVAAKQVRTYGEDGDEMALAIFRQQAMALGRLFTMAANFLDPDAYFLGGGVVEAAPHFRDWFFAEVRANTVLREEQARVAEISLVPELDMAGARGSAYAARDWLAGHAHPVKPATLLSRLLSLGRRDDHDHGQPGGLIARVLVPVRAAGREPGALVRTDLVALTRHNERQRARLDPDHLPGGRRVRVTAERLARHHLPAPELDRPRRVGGADDRPGAAGGTAPEHPRGVRAADLHGGLAAQIDEQGHRDAEGVADAGQGGQVGVGASLFQRDEHALAHAGARGQLVQRPATVRAQRLQGPRDRGRDIGYLRHVFPLWACSRCPGLVERRPFGRYNELYRSIF
jgi:predicted NBD/HSP70 family sugar kinase